MRLAVAVALLLMSAPAAEAAVLPAPIAPADSGKLQCYAPIAETKSCASLAGYQRRSDGKIYNPATVMISPSPLITMKSATVVTIKDGKVCGFITADDAATAEFLIAGKPADAPQTAKMRELLAKAQQHLFGREICTRYLPQTDGSLLASATLDGAPQPPDQKVIWVSPEDGYEVRP